MSWVMTNALRRAIRLFLVVISVLLGWVLIASVDTSAAASTHAEPGPGDAYGGHHHAAPSIYNKTERGPPTTAGRGAAYAVDHWSHGDSARPDTGGQSPAITYDHPAPLVLRVGVATTTDRPSRGNPAAALTFTSWHVAANAGAQGARATLAEVQCTRP